jgi:hypothetical protein
MSLELNAEGKAGVPSGSQLRVRLTGASMPSPAAGECQIDLVSTTVFIGDIGLVHRASHHFKGMKHLLDPPPPPPPQGYEALAFVRGATDHNQHRA